MARFRFARGAKTRGKCRGHKPETMRADVMSAKRNQRGAGADNSVLARIPGTKVAKANDADDQPVDCQAAAPAQGAQHSAGLAGFSAEARCLHARLYDDAEEAELGSP